jgi:hypothetical protein
VDPEQKGSVRSGILVALNTDRHPWSSCPSHIPYSSVPDVFVIESHTAPLRGFWTVGSIPEEPVPADDSPAPHLAIDLGVGGADIIICHDGKWIMTAHN